MFNSTWISNIHAILEFKLDPKRKKKGKEKRDATSLGLVFGLSAPALPVCPLHLSSLVGFNPSAAQENPQHLSSLFCCSPHIGPVLGLRSCGPLDGPIPASTSLLSLPHKHCLGLFVLQSRPRCGEAQLVHHLPHSPSLSSYHSLFPPRAQACLMRLSQLHLLISPFPPFGPSLLRPIYAAQYPISHPFLLPSTKA